MPTDTSARLKSLPTYVFAEIEKTKEEARAKGIDLIDLSMGNPNLPVPKPIIDRMVEALQAPENMRYPTFDGKLAFRKAVSKWYKDRYNVDLDPQDEILPLIGSKEGLAHLAYAYIDTDDVTIAPNPCYPVHARGTLLAGGTVHYLPIGPENDYIPDYKSIPEHILKKTKLFIVSYPSNPTTAVAPREFFEGLVAWAKDKNIILVNDLAYAELAFDGYKPTSLLEIPGAKDFCIEFHTMSKTFSMAGWRVGFALGNKNIIKALYNIKSNMDYGLFPAVQEAAIAALELPQSYIDEICDQYKARRDALIDGLNAIGWKIEKPKATMYCWIPVPKGYTSAQFCEKALLAGVVFSPGNGFGSNGEGYVRASLIVEPAILKEAVARLEKAGLTY